MTDPDARPPTKRSELRQRFERLLDTWSSYELGEPTAPQVPARGEGILQAAASLMGEPLVRSLRGGVDRGDPAALAALVELRALLEMAANDMLRECAEMRRARAWHPMLAPADFALQISVAAGLSPQRGQALILLAQGCRGAGDTRGAIHAYRYLIEVADETEADLLPFAHGNLANALTDTGELDEAFEHYGRALDLETDPSARLRIEANRANAYATLGDLRRAARRHEASVAALEESGAHGAPLAFGLDNAAEALRDLGEHERALALCERARALMPAEEVEGRAINALIRASIHRAAGDVEEGAAAFVEAHDLALERARKRLDPDGSGRAREHYERGFQGAAEGRLPNAHPARRLFLRALAARDEARRLDAIDLWTRAAELASRAGDLALGLQADANHAALEAELGQVDVALDLARQVRQAALQNGFARAELHALATLASLADAGADVAGRLGPLGLLTEARALLDLHGEIVRAAGLSPADLVAEAIAGGALVANLGKQAEDHGAHDLAARYYRETLEVARSTPGSYQLANRLGGLCRALARSGQLAEAAAYAAELEDLLVGGRISDRGRLVAHRALGYYSRELADERRSEAIEHFRRAGELAQLLRDQVEPGPERAEATRFVQDVYRRLAGLLRDAGEDEASFEALQGAKGRRLLDSLSERTGRGASGAPATSADARELVASLGSERTSTLVDLLVEDGSVTAYLIGPEALRTIHIEGDTAALDTIERGDVREREERLIRFCLQNPHLGRLAAEVTAETPEESAILVVPDGLLGNLPLHMIPVDGRPWGERRSISYHVAAGALRFAPGGRRPTGRALVAGDSREDLPYAAAECRTVAELLGTDPILGRACSFQAIQTMIHEEDLDVVHLAVHGRGDVRRGGRSSLLLADDEGQVWIPFEELLGIDWRAELVVFSGCSTAVSGRRHGNALVGVSRAAAEAGAAAVIACLWPVGDEAAYVFMTAFYEELARRRPAGRVDLREVLDHARSATRRWMNPEVAGEQRRDARGVTLVEGPDAEPAPSAEVADGLAWGPFVLLGDPILGG